MTAKKPHCDRCDHVIESTDAKAARKTGYRVWGVKRYIFTEDEHYAIDLCLDCILDLEKFMKTAEPKKPQQQEKLKND